MSEATDEELVRAFRPDARIVSRPHRTGVTQYQVRCAPVPGKTVTPIAWVETEPLAWRSASRRMGLRVRRKPTP